MQFMLRFHFRSATSEVFLVFMSTFLFGISFAHGAVAGMSYTLENNLMKLSNDYYEVALNATNGGIAYIQDRSTEKNIVVGDASSNLWSATLDKGNPILSSSYTELSPKWDADKGTLTLTYTGTINAQVSITTSDSPSLKFQATVTNTAGANIASFELPDSLKISEAEVDNAMMPMMPGAQLSSKFFKEGRTYTSDVNSNGKKGKRPSR